MPPRRESTPLSPTHAAFGEAVRRLREARGLSQEELSDEADVHISQVSDIERGTGNATIRTMARVSSRSNFSLNVEIKLALVVPSASARQSSVAVALPAR